MKPISFSKKNHFLFLLMGAGILLSLSPFFLKNIPSHFGLLVGLTLFCWLVFIFRHLMSWPVLILTPLACLHLVTFKKFYYGKAFVDFFPSHNFESLVKNTEKKSKFFYFWTSSTVELLRLSPSFISFSVSKIRREKLLIARLKTQLDLLSIQHSTDEIIHIRCEALQFTDSLKQEHFRCKNFAGSNRLCFPPSPSPHNQYCGVFYDASIYLFGAK